ncbi:MAG: zinc ribbon domain-containing protein [Candidatus Promineifilaceae bacterium]
MSQVVLLYQLQTIDNEIRAKKKELASVLNSLEEPSTLKEARDQVVSAEKRHKTAQSEQRRLELRLGSHNDKLKASIDRLYSGKVISTRELSDLQKEVEMLKRQQSNIEDLSLEAMLELEEAAEHETASLEQLVEREAAWKVRSGKLENKKQQLAIFLHGALQGRKKHLTLIERKNHATYASIAKKKRGGVAVAELKNDNICSGCLTSVSLATRKKVDQGLITYCGSCSRILVYR